MEQRLNPQVSNLPENLEQQKNILLNQINTRKENIDKLKPTSVLAKEWGCSNTTCQWRTKNTEYLIMKESYDNIIDLYTNEINQFKDLLDNKLETDDKARVIERILRESQFTKLKRENEELKHLLDDVIGEYEKCKNRIIKIEYEREEKIITGFGAGYSF